MGSLESNRGTDVTQSVPDRDALRFASPGRRQVRGDDLSGIRSFIVGYRKREINTTARDELQMRKWFTFICGTSSVLV